MAGWWHSALKAVLPHVGTVLSAATPAFTRKKAAEVASRTLLLQQQITELQSAALENAVNIKELAEQLQATIVALEDAAQSGETKLRVAMGLSVIAVVCSAIALYLVFSR